MAPIPFVASYFSVVLGLSGLGQAWRVAAALWGVSPVIGEALLALSALVWASLLVLYLLQILRAPAQVRQEFHHPIQGCAPALPGISTLLMAVAAVPYSSLLAWALAGAGIAWYLVFGWWHTGLLWRGERQPQDTIPPLYLPTVAASFTSAAALGALGRPDWGWLCLGAGFFSWLALESLIVQRLLHPQPLPSAQRATLGIQFAPPVVCAMAWLALEPGSTHVGLLMLWGYGLFQLGVGLRLAHWLGEQAFSVAYWAYTFGVGAATVTGLKLAVAGVPAARALALPVFVAANLFIGTLALRSGWRVLQTLRRP